jgi:D-alanyl-D-alanine dipeptidase
MKAPSFVFGSFLVAISAVFVLGNAGSLLAAKDTDAQPKAHRKIADPTGVKQSESRQEGSPAPVKQLVVVTADSWNSHKGTLRTFQTFGDRDWQEWGSEVQVSLGRYGMAWGRGLTEPPRGERRKVEGDGRSPAGIFSLGTAFGSAETLPEDNRKYPYLHVEETTYCVEDLRSPHYNQIIDLGDVDARVWRKRSPLLRPDGLFRWGIVVNQNESPPTRGAGSCIFLHVWRGADVGTAGCTAMSEPAIVKLVGWLDERAETRLVQLPRDVYDEVRDQQRLPKLQSASQP